jgi:hypothetical protein
MVGGFQRAALTMVAIVYVINEKLKTTGDMVETRVSETRRTTEGG